MSLTWKNAPYGIRRERTELLLATPRPRPYERNNWFARLQALQLAAKWLPPGNTKDRVIAELNEMDLERAASLARTARQPGPTTKSPMLTCAIRADVVQGLTKTQTHALGICFVDGKPLPPRRIYWCSDECVTLWLSNHEWGAASAAAITRDNATCRHCGHRMGEIIGGRRVALEVNHRDPRNGGGYDQGCFHHQDGLETLCHDCHIKVTNAQRAERKASTEGTTWTTASRSSQP